MSREIKIQVLFVVHNKGFTKSIKEHYTTVERLVNGSDTFDYITGPEIVAKRQFTGLTDTEEKDTYEHDILSKAMSDNSIHTVVIRWSDKYSKFVFCPVGEEWDFDRDVVPNPHNRKGYKVIGNIHQNPELLK